jgi:hypothetical protein
MAGWRRMCVIMTLGRIDQWLRCPPTHATAGPSKRICTEDTSPNLRNVTWVAAQPHMTYSYYPISFVVPEV